MSQPSISERIGSVLCEDGTKGVAYRALRDLVCSSCGKIIKCSEMFTRWQLASPLPSNAALQYAARPRLAARCRACVPFSTEESALLELESTGDAAKLEAPRTSAEASESRKEDAAGRKSHLIEHLMTAAKRPGYDANKSGALTAAGVESEQVEKAETQTDVLTASEAVYRRLAPALHGSRRFGKQQNMRWRQRRQQ